MKPSTQALVDGLRALDDDELTEALGALKVARWERTNSEPEDWALVGVTLTATEMVGQAHTDTHYDAWWSFLGSDLLGAEDGEGSREQSMVLVSRAATERGWRVLGLPVEGDQPTTAPEGQ